VGCSERQEALGEANRTEAMEEMEGVVIVMMMMMMMVMVMMLVMGWDDLGPKVRDTLLLKQVVKFID